MGRMVIVAYRPRAGMEARLEGLVRGHVPALRGLGLATQRPYLAMRAADGTFVEVFEWVSAEAIEQAHTNPEVQKMWKQFAEACEYEILAKLPECQQMFAHFDPFD